jgi:hypothetical protein
MATQLIVNNDQSEYANYDPFEYAKRPYTCECGLHTTLGYKVRHNKTLKHQAYLQQEIYRANGTLEEEERKQAIINEKDKADRKERSRIKGNEYKKEQRRLYKIRVVAEYEEQCRIYMELNKDIYDEFEQHCDHNLLTQQLNLRAPITDIIVNI